MRKVKCMLPLDAQSEGAAWYTVTASPSDSSLMLSQCTMQQEGDLSQSNQWAKVSTFTRNLAPPPPNPTKVFLGRRRRPYIVFSFRSSYGFMFVYIYIYILYIYIFLSFCKWRRSRRSLQSFKSSLMTFRRV